MATIQSKLTVWIKDAAPQSIILFGQHRSSCPSWCPDASPFSMAARFSTLPHTISPLQAVSAPPLQRELAHPFPSSSNRRLLDYSCLKRPLAAAAIRSSMRCCFLVFAAAGQEAATSTLVLQEVDFVWKGEATQVFLTGDFLDWKTKVPLAKADDGAFHAKQKLAPGTYTYKFVVDGKWIHSPDNPTTEDGKGGFNNQIVVTANEVTPKPSTTATSDTTAAKPAARVGAAKPAVKKALQKTLSDVINEDVIPRLRDTLDSEEGISNVDVLFQENQLQGSFVKNEVVYTFWAFFPDGKLEGSRGFSLSSHGAPPSTVEPFLIDEKKVTADLLVFWITKRLFAQKLLSMN